MQRLSENKIILITRKTRLQDLIVRFNTIEQVRFYIEHMGSDFSDYLAEDEQYRKSVLETCNTLESLGRLQTVDRDYLSSFIFGDHDTVVVLGQDGLVANTVKYLPTQLLIGVNPDPKRWDGILLPFQVSELQLVIEDVFRNKRPIKEVTMAKVELNDGQTMVGVNDLFIGQRTHVSARYQIQQGNQRETQSSSGIIVSTGLGSTGWLKSVLAGAANIAGNLSGKKIDVDNQERIEWNSEYLLFSVREPFPSKTTKTEIAFGKITRNSPLKVLSQMPENGVIFSDGIESDFLHFNSGIEAAISVAEQKGRLVV